jgi:hypothetical protein
MSDGEIKNTFTVDNTGALRAIKDAQKEVAKLEKENEKLARSSKKGAQENAEASREAKRLLASLVTEQEKHNKRVAELKRLLADNRISQEQYAAAVRRSQAEVDRAGQSGMDAFGPQAIAAVKSMATAVAGGAGLAAAWKLVTDEINAANEARKRAGEESVTVADAQAGALRNLGATDPADRDRFLSDIKSLADDLQVEEKKLYLLASDALSARGNLSVEQAMEAVRLGAQVAPDDATGTGKAFAGASLDIAKLSGASAEESAGFLMNVGQMARVTDTGRLARNVTPALTAAAAHEGDLPTAGATYAALTGGMGDPTGEQTKTAMIKFAGALDEFLPEVESMRERIAMLQQDEALQKQFLDKYSFEAAAKAPIEQLVTGQGATAEAYADFLGRMPDVEESGDFFRQWLATFKTTSLQVTAEMDRARARLSENLRTADQDAARAGIAIKDLQQTLEDAGMASLGAKLNTFEASVSGEQLEKVLEILQRRQNALEAGPVILGTGYQGAWWSPSGPGGMQQEPEHAAPTEADLRKADALARYIAGIRDIQARLAEADESRPAPAAAGMSTTALENETRTQTRAVEDGNQEIVNEIRGLRQDLQRVTPVTPAPASRPLPSNTSLANQQHS